jgi:hypothetical protein
MNENDLKRERSALKLIFLYIMSRISCIIRTLETNADSIPWRLYEGHEYELHDRRLLARVVVAA